MLFPLYAKVNYVWEMFPSIESLCPTLLLKSEIPVNIRWCDIVFACSALVLNVNRFIFMRFGSLLEEDLFISEIHVTHDCCHRNDIERECESFQNTSGSVSTQRLRENSFEYNI